ncbi:MAG TPA: hypothetical protein VM029_10445 [Opitutaceae bacterium]|nr:hypothetical protein [Opitutaceae bacterium]
MPALPHAVTRWLHFAAGLPKAATFLIARSLLWLLLAIAFGCVEAVVFLTERFARLSRSAGSVPVAEPVTRSGS